MAAFRSHVASSRPVQSPIPSRPVAFRSVPSLFSSSRLVQPRLVPSNPIPSRPIPLCPAPLRLVLSRPTLPVQPRPIPSNLVPFNPSKPSCLSPSHPVPPHLLHPVQQGKLRRSARTPRAVPVPSRPKLSAAAGLREEAPGGIGARYRPASIPIRRLGGAGEG